MGAIVEAAGVKKHFGKVEALAGLDLTVESGQVVAVLGPNGAGKTTFVRTVATLLRPDEGTVRVAGFDVGRDADRVRQVDRARGPARRRRGGDDRAREPRGWSPSCTASRAARPSGVPPVCSSG